MTSRAGPRRGREGPERRKQDGVYYTPAWLARILVALTLGGYLRERRAVLGLGDAPTGALTGEPGPLRAYAAELAGVAVVDPACGAAALLVEALAWLHAERRRLAAALGQDFDAAAEAAAIVAANLYGVDIRADAVAAGVEALAAEAARLAGAAVPVRARLRVGDALLDEAFDWQRSFSEVFAGPDPGFACVLGNPPYVKLQQLPRERAEQLIGARTATGEPRYASTQTGSFDLCLPFIERGLGLLAGRGWLGYVAPSTWVINEHGEGLRGLVARTRSLARWIDLRGYQAFRGATTYTALQVFRGRPQAGIQVEFAARGPADLERLLGPDGRAQRAPAPLAYAELPARGPWRLLPAAEAALVEGLGRRCPPLASVCEAISVGVQTSADAVYQLERVGPGRYRPAGAGADAAVVELEDAIMRPLLSGAEVDRYCAPRTRTWLLFPYEVDEAGARLIPAARLAAELPRAWAYLRGHEPRLRARERGKMDRDDRWWGYNYPKNLAKQGRPKLVVAQTVPSLRVAYDERGEFWLDNVRVNGVYTDGPEQAWFLLGVLNGPIADRVFRATAKPKAGGYFEANRQFIAPLPIPPASPAQRRAVAELAQTLQRLHSRRAELGEAAAELDAELAAREAELDALLVSLYGLGDGP